MPTAIHFEGSEEMTPTNFTHPECYDLPTMIQVVPFGESKTAQITSCWQLSTEEIERLSKNGGVVYISLMGSQPPISVSLEKPELKIEYMEFVDIARRLQTDLDSARIVEHGNEGRIYLTFAEYQFDLSKEEWQQIQNLYADLN